MTRMTIDLYHDRLTYDQRRELITSLVECLVPTEPDAWCGPTWLRIDMVKTGNWGEPAFKAAGFVDLAFGKAA